MIIRIIVDLIQLYIVLLFLRIILTWFPVNPWSNVAKLVNLLARLTDPVLVPVRRLLPPLRIGGGAVDLSPIAVFVVLQILISVLRPH
jgi:YggT family protein